MLPSDRFPVLYRPSVAVHRGLRSTRWLLEHDAEPRREPGLATPFRIARHSSILLRRLGGVDMELQRNKVHNLGLALAGIDGRVLRPGQTLSFWRSIGDPSAGRGYLPGLVLVHGRMASAVGGGLCQLSNLLHWLVLHTPLEVVERHHHGYDPFPDSGRQVPFGSGATVFYNYVDLRFGNPTPAAFRLRLWLTDTELHGELWSDWLPPLAYHVREEGHRFFRRDGRVYRENRLYRVAVERVSGREAGCELVAQNVFPVLYEPAPDVTVEAEAPAPA
jgi:vancomycin resistance protein VanW